MCKRINKGKELNKGVGGYQFHGYSVKLIRVFSYLSHRKGLDHDIVKGVYQDIIRQIGDL